MRLRDWRERKCGDAAVRRLGHIVLDDCGHDRRLYDVGERVRLSRLRTLCWALENCAFVPAVIATATFGDAGSAYRR